MADKYRTFLAACLAILTLVAPLRGDEPKEITADAVREAIQKGVQYLQEQQHPAGGYWREMVQHPGGVTSLCTLALLNAGVPKTDPSIKKALGFLEKVPFPPNSTYSASLYVMVLCAADPVAHKTKIGQLAHWIESKQIRTGDNKGCWAYPGQGRGDNSNAQFALLALHEAERAGIKIEDQTWQLALNYWTTNGMQKSTGAWGYTKNEPASGSMTCAGIASVIMAQDRLSMGDVTVAGETLQCCGKAEENDAVARGFEWLAKTFTTKTNPNTNGLNGTPISDSYLLYFLYGVERVGRMSGQRYIGEHDWYREGSEHLVAQKQLAASGGVFWTGTGEAERDPNIGTALVLLFLSKGRRPIVIAKLKHAAAEAEGSLRDWDQHRRGIQNLTSRIEKQWKKDLSWQTIDVTKASVADLLEAPVLFLSGSESLAFTPQQKKNLKEYINQGGFLFAEACDGQGCNGKQFDRDFRALMKELFPESELRRLPPDHAVWFAQESVDPAAFPKDPDFWLYGLDACCRTSVVYCPKALSCRWDLAHPYRQQTLPADLKAEVEACTRLGTNVVAYATNRQLKEKLDRPQIAVSENLGKVPRGALALPKLRHGGGADDAPNAVANLLTVLDKQLQRKVDYQKRLIAPSDKALLDHPLVFLHGRRGFEWTSAERKSLKEYLAPGGAAGGVLFADAICGNVEFADSFRAEIAAILPGTKFTRLPATHPLFTDELGGFDVRSVTLRDPLVRGGADPLEAKLIKTSPILEVAEYKGRIVAILSPYDLSCALEKGASLECKGYITADAARLGINVLLYTLQQ